MSNQTSLLSYFPIKNDDSKSEEDNIIYSDEYILQQSNLQENEIIENSIDILFPDKFPSLNKQFKEFEERENFNNSSKSINIIEGIVTNITKKHHIYINNKSIGIINYKNICSNPSIYKNPNYGKELLF